MRYKPEHRAQAIAILRALGLVCSDSIGTIELGTICARRLGRTRVPQNKVHARVAMLAFIRAASSGTHTVAGDLDAARKASEPDRFYKSREWRQLRYLALRNCGGGCQCCGAKGADGAVLHVDHIKPRSVFPDLALCLDNLQVLCEDCNFGKGAWDQTDFRVPLRA